MPILPIDKTAEHWKEIGFALYFIQAYEAICHGFKEKLGIVQTSEIGRTFQIEIGEIRHICTKTFDHCGFPALTRSKKDYGRKVCEVFFYFGRQIATEQTVHMGSLPSDLHGCKHVVQSEVVHDADLVRRTFLDYSRIHD